MRDGTKYDMMKLQTYGAMYLAGANPVDIQAMYNSPDMTLDSLSQSLGSLAGEGQTRVGMENAASVVQMVFQGVAAIAALFPGVGTIIGAVFSVVGTLVSRIIGSRATVECDEDKCRAEPGGARDWRHRRAIVGIGLPSNARLDNDWNCKVKHYGGTKSACMAEWGLFATYMNDGFWWWMKQDANKHADLLKGGGGTVIGVKGKVTSGATKNCHRRTYSRWETPKLEGMPDLIQSDADLSPEFKARQDAVTQVLGWMARRMNYSVLSCFEELLLNYRGGAEYRIGPGDSDAYNEGSLAEYMRHPQGQYSFGATQWPYNNKTASRIYASIRGMFQAVVAMSARLSVMPVRDGMSGAGHLRRIMSLSGVAGNWDELQAAIREQQRGDAVWPERVFADVTSFDQLKDFHFHLTEYIRETILTDPALVEEFVSAAEEVRIRNLPPTQRQRARAKIVAEKAIAAKTLGFGYGISYAPTVRRDISNLLVNPRAMGPGGLGKFAWGVPGWALYGGAAVLAVGSIYLLWKAQEEDDE